MIIFSRNIFLFVCFLVASELLFAGSNTITQQIAYEEEPQKNSGDIYLSISNIPTETTGLIVSIYRSQDSFLKKADESYHFPIDTIKKNELLLKQISYGEFVIAIAADLNTNKLLDTKLLGLPKEPVGFVNNPKLRFGPPRFKDLVLKHDRSEQRFTVSLVKI
jgi:uncharacterized protein (DUF2141 family)